jgi:hypothetical protein
MAHLLCFCIPVNHLQILRLIFRLLLINELENKHNDLILQKRTYILCMTCLNLKMILILQTWMEFINDYVPFIVSFLKVIIRPIQRYNNDLRNSGRSMYLCIYLMSLVSRKIFITGAHFTAYGLHCRAPPAAKLKQLTKSEMFGSDSDSAEHACKVWIRFGKSYVRYTSGDVMMFTCKCKRFTVCSYFCKQCLSRHYNLHPWQAWVFLSSLGTNTKHAAK